MGVNNCVQAYTFLHKGDIKEIHYTDVAHGYKIHI